MGLAMARWMWTGREMVARGKGRVVLHQMVAIRTQNEAGWQKGLQRQRGGWRYITVVVGTITR